MLYSVRRVATQRDSFARVEMLTLLALSVLLIVAAILRQEFIGDGIRHVQTAISSSRPVIGAARWLLFPSLAWILIRPFVGMGLVTDVGSGIRVLLFASVASGIVYLFAIRLWLRAEGHDARARTAALIVAASTMPFFMLYADVAEVQMAACAVVAALAVARARTAAGRTADGTVLALVAVIASATLVYQGLIVAMACVPLVVPLDRIRRWRVLSGWVLILAAVPLVMILARVITGDAASAAMETTIAGESNVVARSSMGQATPAKWAAAFLAGPPQAIVRLANFQGLPVLARDVRSPSTRRAAIVDTVRLGGGLILVWVMVFAIVTTRDWRLALALLAVVALPVVRNGQYTYHKFYVLWPALMALASTKFPAGWALSAGAIVLMLNGTLVARDVADGRHAHSEMQGLYQTAASGSCFFTSEWSAPFPYLWPGMTAGIISDLWRWDGSAPPHPLTTSLERCFCGSSRVWTDTTQDERQAIERLVTQFRYTEAPVLDLLYRPGDGSQVAGKPVRIFIYSPDRQAQFCRRVVNR
jgi:hypothetical protein